MNTMAAEEQETYRPSADGKSDQQNKKEMESGKGSDFISGRVAMKCLGYRKSWRG